jgi:hypothetical protein
MKMNEAEARRGVALFQQVWTAQKAGHEEGQNEDAWRTVCSHGAADSTWLIAVADGATEAVYARSWARALAAAAGADWPLLSDDELNERLQSVRAAFQPFAAGEEIPWYVQTKWLTLGSQATLLVATVASARGADELAVRAVAVGDSCLLLFRQGEPQVLSFPIESAAGFGVNPALVRSRFRDALEFRRLPPTRMRPGDLLLVCTDAVGKWALKCLESGQRRLLFDALRALLAAEAAHEALAGTTARAAAVTPPQIVIPVVRQKPQPAPARLLPRWQVAKVVQGWFPKVFGPPGPEQTDSAAESKPAPPSAPLASEAAPPSQFEQFVARFRAPDAEPRMGNDDSTLVLCLPVWAGDSNPRQAALAAVRKFDEFFSAARQFSPALSANSQ